MNHQKILILCGFQGLLENNRSVFRFSVLGGTNFEVQVYTWYKVKNKPKFSERIKNNRSVSVGYQTIILSTQYFVDNVNNSGDNSVIVSAQYLHYRDKL